MKDFTFSRGGAEYSPNMQSGVATPYILSGGESTNICYGEGGENPPLYDFGRGSNLYMLSGESNRIYSRLISHYMLSGGGAGGIQSPMLPGIHPLYDPMGIQPIYSPGGSTPICSRGESTPKCSPGDPPHICFRGKIHLLYALGVQSTPVCQNP